MSERIDIATVVADHFRRCVLTPPDALDTARAVDDAFFTIPRQTLANGLLLVEMPTRHELPCDMWGMVRFRLSARARRIDQ